MGLCWDSPLELQRNTSGSSEPSVTGGEAGGRDPAPQGLSAPAFLCLRVTWRSRVVLSLGLARSRCCTSVRQAPKQGTAATLRPAPSPVSESRIQAPQTLQPTHTGAQESPQVSEEHTGTAGHRQAHPLHPLGHTALRRHVLLWQGPGCQPSVWPSI